MGMIAIAAGTASAQITFDGNIFFNNNATGTLAGQFNGAPTAAAPACSVGTTAALLGTLKYPNNLHSDPLLPTARYIPNVLPSFQPDLGSPAYGSAVTVPGDGFFQQVCYRGAIGPNADDDWTEGWTYFDSTGTGRQDLHLTGMPDPRPLAVYDNISIFSNAYFCTDSNYLVRGQLRIKAQAVLSICPGTVIFQEKASIGTIVVERGGRLYAVGTQCAPIIITGDAAPGTSTRGQGGGIVHNGFAKTNVVNSCLGDSSAVEGFAVGVNAAFFGGNNDAHCAGALRYVRVEYAGVELAPNNELNSFVWAGCGTGTKGDYLESYFGADDGFEWFGGSMNNTHLIAIDGTDDGYDWQLGTRNKAQFVIVRTTGQPAPASTNGQFGERGIEADNNEFNNDQVQCAGRSFCQIANATFIGDKRTGPNFPGATQGIELRRGTGATILNSIVYNFKTHGLRISDQPTWQAHCLALGGGIVQNGPTLACPGTVGVIPITEGNVFVANSHPNPFRNSVNFTFSLPQAGPVQVDIFSADGRHVQTLASGHMEAGPHSIAWTIDKATPSGVYFYKVSAANGLANATGKITKVN